MLQTPLVSFALSSLSLLQITAGEEKFVCHKTGESAKAGLPFLLFEKEKITRRKKTYVNLIDHA